MIRFSDSAAALIHNLLPRYRGRIDDRRVRFDASHQAFEAGECVVKSRGNQAEHVAGDVEAYAARNDETAKEAVAREPFVHLLEALLQAHPGGGAVVERGAGADVADIADVVVEPLQLESDGPDKPRPRRRVDAGNLFQCFAVAQAVRDRAHPADTLSNREGVEGWEPFHALLQPAMGVEQARVEIQHSLADRREPEVTRFDDAGVDRADIEEILPAESTSRR